MKIIGETDKGWICELTTDEIANFQGLDNTYRDRFKNPKVGMVLDISKNWSQFWKVNTILMHKETLVQHCNKIIQATNELKIEACRFEDEND